MAAIKLPREIPYFLARATSLYRSAADTGDRVRLLNISCYSESQLPSSVPTGEDGLKVLKRSHLQVVICWHHMQLRLEVNQFVKLISPEVLSQNNWYSCCYWKF